MRAVHTPQPVTILHKTQVIAIIDCVQGAWLHTSLFS